MKVIRINGFQFSSDEEQGYDIEFILVKDDENLEDYSHLGCVYESSLEEAAGFGFSQEDLENIDCVFTVYSKLCGEWV